MRASNGYQNGLATFLNSTNPFALVTQAGIPALQITANPGSPWTSGLICTMAPGGAGFAQAPPVYWEAKVFSPTGTNGFWPAFWFLGTGANGNGPFIEIDDFEEYGYYASQGQELAESSFYGHGNGINGATVVPNNGYVTVPTLQTAWHTFGCLATMTQVIYYIDGVQVGSAAVPSDAPTQAAMAQPQFAIINLGMGPQSYNPITSNSPTTLYIAYLRCWSLSGNPTPTPTANAVTCQPRPTTPTP